MYGHHWRGHVARMEQSRVCHQATFRLGLGGGSFSNGKRGQGHDQGEKGRKNSGSLKLRWDAWHQEWHQNPEDEDPDWTVTAKNKDIWFKAAGSFMQWAHMRFRLGGLTANGSKDMQLFNERRKTRAKAHPFAINPTQSQVPVSET